MLRRYRGFMADSARWERFEFRPDDVVISSPSKCGTTWTQQIVGSLLLDQPVLGHPISRLSPWLDMLIHTDDQVVELLAAQTHRRFIKTHTPLDGIPYHDTVTYFALARHPLDVALSDRDHGSNMRRDQARSLRAEASGQPADLPDIEFPASDDSHDVLTWFIDNENPPTGSGPNGLADMCQQVAVAWARRAAPNVHLLHYHDLWNDLDGEMRRIADALGAPVADERWSEFVEAAMLDSMRGRSHHAAPEVEHGLWRLADDFFRQGGRRNWADALNETEIRHFEQRLADLAGDAAGWLVAGRSALAV